MTEFLDKGIGLSDGATFLVIECEEGTEEGEEGEGSVMAEKDEREDEHETMKVRGGRVEREGDSDDSLNIVQSLKSVTRGIIHFG